MIVQLKYFYIYVLLVRKDSGKLREEAQKEKKQELKKQLEDVKVQLGGSVSVKKLNKKGNYIFRNLIF